MNEEGVSIRPPASAFLLIDSRDRLYTTNQPEYIQISQGEVQPLNDFVIQKQQPINTGFFTRIGVTEVKFPWFIPNVNERNNQFIYKQYYNSTFQLTSTIGPSTYTLPGLSTLFEFTVTMPERFYTPEDIAITMSNIINVECEVNFSTITGSNIPNNFQAQWLGNSPQFIFTSLLPSPFNYFTIEPIPSQARGGFISVLNMPMDYTPSNTFGPSSNNPIITSNIVNPFNVQSSQPAPKMCYTDYIDICSRKLTNYQRIKDNSTRENQTPGILARIYVNDNVGSGFGWGSNTYSVLQPNLSSINYPSGAEKSWFGCSPTTIYRNFPVPKYSTWSPGQFVDQIDIQLRDDNGDLLYIPKLFGPQGQGGTTQFQNFQLTLHASET